MHTNKQENGAMSHSNQNNGATADRNNRKLIMSCIGRKVTFILFSASGFASPIDFVFVSFLFCVLFCKICIIIIHCKKHTTFIRQHIRLYGNVKRSEEKMQNTITVSSRRKQQQNTLIQYFSSASSNKFHSLSFY